MSDHFIKKGVYVDSFKNIIITITKVELSSDLRYAKIFITTINTTLSNALLINALNRNSKAYKFIISKNLRIKKIPDLRFHYDNIYKNNLIIDKND